MWTLVMSRPGTSERCLSASAAPFTPRLLAGESRKPQAGTLGTEEASEGEERPVDSAWCEGGKSSGGIGKGLSCLGSKSVGMDALLKLLESPMLKVLARAEAVSCALLFPALRMGLLCPVRDCRARPLKTLAAQDACSLARRVDAEGGRGPEPPAMGDAGGVASSRLTAVFSSSSSSSCLTSASSQGTGGASSPSPPGWPQLVTAAALPAPSLTELPPAAASRASPGIARPSSPGCS
mmetsp:Transcript_31584/g.90612  ORF Transcript_31584/g.90612 Transcript_31584/m.90612 type:complete len:237 (+) Transcript_31584:1077-1787(+)